MIKTIAIVATLDTKGEEVKFAKELIEKLGHHALIIDVGVWLKPTIIPDITREDVAKAAGKEWELVLKGEKAERIKTMMKGISILAPALYLKGKFNGILSMGGAQNTALGTTAMQALPFGVPKVMLSTVASGYRIFEPLMGTKDISIMHSVADISGINSITKTVISNAVAAVVGMTKMTIKPSCKLHKTVIGATMLGVTNDGVTQATNIIKNHGWEVITFHANGVGGRAMEELINKRKIGAVLDLTLHEITSEIFGGYSFGAKHRLEAAGRAGIPQVIVPGAVDVVDFKNSNLPSDWTSRKYIYQHPTILLHLKLHYDEIIQVAKVIADRLNQSRGPVTILIPNRGFCQDDKLGGALWDPPINQAFIETLRELIKPKIKWKEIVVFY